MTKEAAKNTDPSILEQLSNIPLPDDVRNNLSQTEWDQMMNNVFSDLMKDDQVKDNIKELQNAAIPSHTIQPQSGFVLKTHLNKSTQSYPAGLKVFINMTHSPEIPAPPLCTDEEIKRAIEAADTSYKVPLSLAELRDGEDKGGRPCVVFSACINSDPFFKSENDFDFKLFIIELAMELIEERFKMELSREFTLPKLKHKGPVMPHVIRRPKRAAITDLSRDKVKDKSSATNPKSLIMTSEAEPKIIPLSSQKEKIPNYRVTKSDDGTKLLIDIELPELTSISMKPLDLHIEPSLVELHIADLYHLKLNMSPYLTSEFISRPVPTGKTKFEIDVTNTEKLKGIFVKDSRVLHVVIIMK